MHTNKNYSQMYLLTMVGMKIVGSFLSRTMGSIIKLQDMVVVAVALSTSLIPFHPWPCPTAHLFNTHKYIITITMYRHNGDNIRTKNVTTEGNGSTAVLNKLDNIQGGISDLKVASNDILATAKKANQPSRERFNAGDENLLAQDFLRYSTPTPRHLRFETSERAPPVSQSLAMGVPNQPQNL